MATRSIFKAEIRGLETWEVYVYVRDGDSPGHDIHTAGQAVTRLAHGAFRVGDVSKVARVPADAKPIAGFTFFGDQWAWYRQTTRADGAKVK